MKALFLTKYSNLGASSRYRVYQYLPFLESNGFSCTVQPLFPNNYLKSRYDNNQNRLTKIQTVFHAYTQRLRLLISNLDPYNVIYVEYEALPYLPLALEKLLFTTNTRIVVDYDDAIHVNYSDHAKWIVRKLLGSKVPKLVKRSSQIIVGNRYLGEWANQFNTNVTIIPTSINLDKYTLPRKSPAVRSKPIIGWIGTPITAQYLQLLERVFHSLSADHDFCLKIIGAPHFQMDGVCVEAVPWLENTEVDVLQGCDIGIMPLPNNSWARGKSALKLIQYLAASVPAVASPVGANIDVIQDGENGFLAASDAEWIDKLSQLLQRPLLRQKFATAGRKTAEERYSIQQNAPLLAEVLRKAALGAA